MKISHLLQSKGFSWSCEFFPYKTQKSRDALLQQIPDIIDIIDYISITYPSWSDEDGQYNDKIQSVLELSQKIKDQLQIEVLVHMTSRNKTVTLTRTILDMLAAYGIDNILALRGDIDGTQTLQSPFRYAQNLVHFVSRCYNFDIGVACYPECHIESKNVDQEILYLKKKVDAGATFAITQFFFDNSAFFDFMDKVRQSNIKIPIIVGVLPIFDIKKVIDFSFKCGTSIPSRVLHDFESIKASPEEVSEYGIQYSINQCQELIRSGAIQGMHFYTINRLHQTKRIITKLQHENKNY